MPMQHEVATTAGVEHRCRLWPPAQRMSRRWCIYIHVYVYIYIHTRTVVWLMHTAICERLCGSCTMHCASGGNGLQHIATGNTYMHVSRLRSSGNVAGLPTPPGNKGLLELLRGPAGVEPECRVPPMVLLGFCGYVGWVETLHWATRHTHTHARYGHESTHNHPTNVRSM